MDNIITRKEKEWRILKKFVTLIGASGGLLLGTAFLNATPGTAQPLSILATTTVHAADAQIPQTSININKDNYSTYFKNVGTATYDPSNGVVNLVHNAGSEVVESGMSYLNGNIDLNKDFSLSGEINIKPGKPAVGDDPGLSDGIAFAFRPGDPTQVGNPGSGLGVGGIEGAFGVVMDTFYNSFAEANRGEADSGIGIPGYISFFQNKYEPNLKNADPSDKLKTGYVRSVIYPTPQQDSIDNIIRAAFKPDVNQAFNISYNGTTKVMTYTLSLVDDSGTKVLTKTHDFSDLIKKYGPEANFAISSASQLSQADVNIIVNSIHFSGIGVVNVNYRDEANSQTDLVPTKTLKGGLTESANLTDSLKEIDTLRSQGYRLDHIDAPADFNADKSTLPFGGTSDLSKLAYKDVLQEVNLYFKKDVEQPLNIKVIHVDADHQNKPIGTDQTITGAFGTTGIIPAQSIQGYTADPANPASIKFGSLDKDGKALTTITLKYHSNKIPTNGSTNNQTTTPIRTTPTTTSKPSTPAASSSQPGTAPASPATPAAPASPTSSAPDQNTPLAKKGTVVYSIKPIYLYRHANFKKSERVAFYQRKPRIYRPMFVVTDTIRNQSGQFRYIVKDVNHHNVSAGKTGYITTSWKYVRPVYYATQPSEVTVISPNGINGYRNKNLTGKARNYRQGTILKVKGIVKHNLTTRYVLTNGRYITANRKLVNMGRHATAKTIRARSGLNRYQTANLSGRHRHFKKGTTFKVYGYDYSKGSDLHQYGALRYRVAGGYITTNPGIIKIIR